MEGNVQAEKKIRLTQKLFEIAGIGKDRLHLAWVSSAEAQRFVEVVTTVTESVKSQGKFDPKALSSELAATEITLIYQAIKDGSTSVRDINEKIGLDLERISYLLADLEKTNKVGFTGMEDSKPVFAVL
ncbi:MAG: hydrogenase iron-sulfur subunit [Deltaproteobacteria bacterium]|nr:hydrogenase iron-sulfur subunit [Deltaproteobacteria bacterium]